MEDINFSYFQNLTNGLPGAVGSPNIKNSLLPENMKNIWKKKKIGKNPG